MHVVLRIYRALFARRRFYKFNKLLYRASLSGMGILNYENEIVRGERRFLKKHLEGRRTCIVFDVGANVGSYAKKVFEINSTAILYAFEPHPKTYQVLINNLRQPNFFPVNAAAGSADGESYLYDYELNDGSSHASLYCDVIEGVHNKKSLKHKIKIIALGGFAKEQKIEKIDLLKIDTEGNEFNVLDGISDCIESGMIEAIHFEFNEMNVSSRTYFRDFWNLLSQYDLYRLLPDGMVKIEKYRPVDCEIFAYQNIVAILKKVKG